LDYRLVEYAFGLPPEQKIDQGVTKVVLRRAMKGTLPEAIRSRKDKMAFGTPEGIWFRTILRNPISEIITSKRFAERGYFDAQKVNKGFEEHLEGKINLDLPIWRYVNMELWLITFIDGKPSPDVWKRDG
jgi:asparagine synthase (glutamine-hydrolysing)